LEQYFKNLNCVKDLDKNIDELKSYLKNFKTLKESVNDKMKSLKNDV
jgi:hypothetical protein